MSRSNRIDPILEKLYEFYHDNFAEKNSRVADHLNNITIDTSLIEKDRGSSEVVVPPLILPSTGTALSITSPFYLSGSPLAYGSVSYSIGLSLGSTLLGFPLNIGFGDHPKEEDEIMESYNPPLICQYTGFREESDIVGLSKCDVVEIDPYFYFVGSEKYQDHPGFLPELRKGKDLSLIVEMIKEINDVPVILHLPASCIERDMDRTVVSGVEGIIIHCENPPVGKISRGFDFPSRDPVSAITEATSHLSTFESRGEKIKLILDSRISRLDDCIKLLCLGADAILLDNLLETYSLYEFWRDEDGGLNGSEIFEKSPDWASIGEGIQGLVEDMHDAMEEKFKIMGIDPEKDLSRKNLRSCDYVTSYLSGLKIAGRNRVLPIWRH